MTRSKLQDRMYEVIFKAETPVGKAFDVFLILLILFSLTVIVLESVDEYHVKYANLFHAIEWVITILFSFEYIARIYSSKGRKAYVFSFYGIIDLLAILPTFLSILFPGFHYLATVRGLRLLRVFRVFKMNRYLRESHFLMQAMYASRLKISLFLSSVITIVVIIGSLMYFIEGSVNENFSNIPQSMYWAIVTLTTVGYGDIVPITVIGKFFASMLMILGYAIIAVPTGIVTAEMTSLSANMQLGRKCDACGLLGHDSDAAYCKQCGSPLS
jgi:voltage-gated potassium channel